MGTKNKPGKYDCYEKADLNEPMFVLLARDKHAPILVQLWARLRDLEDEDAHVVSEALNCAAAMEDWRRTELSPAL